MTPARCAPTFADCDACGQTFIREHNFNLHKQFYCRKTAPQDQQWPSQKPIAQAYLQANPDLLLKYPLLARAP
jgi:hypothetical protein